MKNGLFVFTLIGFALLTGQSWMPQRWAAHVYYSGAVQAKYLRTLDAIDACAGIKSEEARETCFSKI